MAFSYQQHEQSDTSNTNTHTTTHSSNFDAPLIGDLKLDTNNNNNNNNTINDIYSNDETDTLAQETMTNDNPFYDDTMSTFGMPIDDSNMYGSPSLGFDHLTTPMPSMMHLDTSPLPPFDNTNINPINVNVNTNDTNNNNNNTTTNNTTTNTNNNNSNNNSISNTTNTNTTDNTCNNNSSVAIDTSFNSEDPSILDNFHHIYPSYNDDSIDPMIDSIRYGFSSRSEFHLDPLDQNTILTVSDGISQFLTPTPNYNVNITSSNNNTPIKYTNNTNTVNTNDVSNYNIHTHTNPFGTPNLNNNRTPIPLNTNNKPINNSQSTSTSTSTSATTSRPSSSGSGSGSTGSSSTIGSSSTTTTNTSITTCSSSTASSTDSGDDAIDIEPTIEVDIDMTPKEDKPKTYEIIKKNIFISRKKRTYTNRSYQYKCDCHYTANGDNCDKNACYNKLFYYECTSKESCSVQDETGDANLCKNRKFQRNEWRNVLVKSSGKKGWGLYANENIECGEFVIEYVGEVINEKECKKRLATIYLNKNKFYILKLEGGKKGDSIDATRKGCPARFMNHSCDPNCKAQKWTVGGELCLGFFADKDIKKGDELTFDYQFQRYGNIRQKCYCGAKNCRKYLGAPSNKLMKSPIRKGKKKGKKDKRVYRKNKKIVQRNMDERIVVTQCYDYLMRLMDRDGIDNLSGVSDGDLNDNKRCDVLNKCMAKGRLLRRQYINNCTGNLLRKMGNNDVSFDQIIGPYECDNIIDNSEDMLLLREEDTKTNLLNIKALQEFENIITKQYKIGHDFELEHLQKMKRMNENLNSKVSCTETSKCNLCILYGIGSCITLPIYQSSQRQNIIKMSGNDEQVKKKYLKLKQVSQRKVMEHKIKNSNKKKKKYKKIKKHNDTFEDTDKKGDTQSDADSAYAANLHKQLNKPHLRRRTRTNKISVESTHTIETVTPPNISPIYGETKTKINIKTDIPVIETIHETDSNNTIQQVTLSAIMNDTTLSSLQPVIMHDNIDNINDNINDNDIDTEIEICDKCGITKDSLKTKGTWSRHLHSKHTYYCKQCPAQFTTAIILQEHEKQNHKNNLFIYKSSAQKIIKKMSDESNKIFKDGLPDKCLKCGRYRGDTAKSHWNKHINTDHRYPCPHCEYKFAHRKKYNEHLESTHCVMRGKGSIGNDDDSDGSSNGNRKYKKKYKKKHKRKLRKHNMNVDGRSSDSDSDEEDCDVEMKGNDDGNEKKRKYNQLGEEKPRKRRKLNNDNDVEQNQNQNQVNDEKIFENDEIIRNLEEERDKELTLYEFADFEGYDEDEELMVSIYDKMDKNDMKYKQVFEQEETLNQEIIDCMKDFKPNTSIFNALIFTNKNNNINIKSEIKLPQNNNIQSKPQPIHQPQPQPQPRYNTIVTRQPIRSIQQQLSPQPMLLRQTTQVTPQPIIVQSQPITQPQPQPLPPKKVSTNAHFSGGSNMKITHKPSNKPHANHHSNHRHYSNNNKYHNNNNSTPIHTHPHTRSNSSHSHTNHDRMDRINDRTNNRHSHSSHSHTHRHNNNRYNNRYNNSYKQDPENKTLFVDNIPMGITSISLENALKKNGSIKDIMLRTKQNQQSQYANVTCYQKHICDSLIIAGKKPIPLQLPNGKIIHQKLSIHYHNQQKVDEAREKRRKEMEDRIKNQS